MEVRKTWNDDRIPNLVSEFKSDDIWPPFWLKKCKNNKLKNFCQFFLAKKVKCCQISILRTDVESSDHSASSLSQFIRICSICLFFLIAISKFQSHWGDENQHFWENKLYHVNQRENSFNFGRSHTFFHYAFISTQLFEIVHTDAPSADGYCEGETRNFRGIGTPAMKSALVVSPPPPRLPSSMPLPIDIVTLYSRLDTHLAKTENRCLLTVLWGRNTKFTCDWYPSYKKCGGYKKCGVRDPPPVPPRLPPTPLSIVVYCNIETQSERPVRENGEPHPGSDWQRKDIFTYSRRPILGRNPSPLRRSPDGFLITASRKKNGLSCRIK